MKKVPALIVLLAASAFSTLSALDVYVNDVLWRSYSDEALDALVTEIPSDRNPPSLPFALLLPLMEDPRGLHLLFRGGDARLESDEEKMREARLVRGADGVWELVWDGSRYSRPRRAELFGRRMKEEELLLWAEPGLEGFEKQIGIWCSLHKLELSYREIEGIDDELLHRRLTGEELPDLVLVLQKAGDPFSEEETAAYLLRSSLNTGDPPEKLVLPGGERFHPELFLSLLRSLENSEGTRDSALSPRFPSDRASLMRGRDVYLGLMLDRRIVEKEGHSGSYGKVYYPARAFPRIPGTLASIPEPGGKGYLPPRILPVQLKSAGLDFPAAPLLDFLKLPGIQHTLFVPSARQLPVLTEILEEKQLSPEETALYREWETGYVLSEKNAPFVKGLKDMFPDLYRSQGVLP